MIKRFYVPTSKLEEGMQIDQVIKDRLDRTLIARGSALDAYLIEGLKKRGIHGVYIKTGEEDPEEKPEEETLTPFVRNKIEKYRTEDPRKVYLSESVKKRVSEGIQYLYNNSDSPEFTNTSAKITNDLIHAIDHNDALAVDISALKTSYDLFKGENKGTCIESCYIYTYAYWIGRYYGFIDEEGQA